MQQSATEEALMGVTIMPVTPDFVAEIGDVDLARPMPDADFEVVRRAFFKYAVLVFPNQDITPQQQLDFAARFGPIENERTLDPKATPSRFPGAFSDISNLTSEGKIWGETSRQRMYKAGNKLWHTDSSFKYLPSLTSLLHSSSTRKSASASRPCRSCSCARFPRRGASPCSWPPTPGASTACPMPKAASSSTNSSSTASSVSSSIPTDGGRTNS
jgi:hypothetical protein